MGDRSISIAPTELSKSTDGASLDLVDLQTGHSSDSRYPISNRSRGLLAAAPFAMSVAIPLLPEPARPSTRMRLPTEKALLIYLKPSSFVRREFTVARASARATSNRLI